MKSYTRLGIIHQFDQRASQLHTSYLKGHDQEVCGLKWSPDGRYLASGGNDNIGMLLKQASVKEIRIHFLLFINM